MNFLFPIVFGFSHNPNVYVEEDLSSPESVNKILLQLDENINVIDDANCVDATGTDFHCEYWVNMGYCDNEAYPNMRTTCCAGCRRHDHARQLVKEYITIQTPQKYWDSGNYIIAEECPKEFIHIQSKKDCQHLISDEILLPKNDITFPGQTLYSEFYPSLDDHLAGCIVIKNVLKNPHILFNQPEKSGKSGLKVCRRDVCEDQSFCNRLKNTVTCSELTKSYCRKTCGLCHSEEQWSIEKKKQDFEHWQKQFSEQTAKKLGYDIEQLEAKIRTMYEESKHNKHARVLLQSPQDTPAWKAVNFLLDDEESGTDQMGVCVSLLHPVTYTTKKVGRKTKLIPKREKSSYVIDLSTAENQQKKKTRAKIG